MANRLPNLDLAGRHVRKGLLVSWHGLRGRVVRVRTGRCVVRWVVAASCVPDQWLPCGSVQVVAC